ncbi:endonuclease [Flavimarina sp. Hel_I_48]|uniref:endonuclease n=1 Tax=Flavimarina sp. Hel_I_48 TaxID=1392488 RepID=UPI0004DEF13F|nr:endonuclease [Flavimarina sp. Hel_I_48]
MKHYFLLIFLFTIGLSYGQLVINELDCDSPGYDDREFIELRSEDAYFPLDGYLVVLFNGSENGMDSSYFTIDLTGFVTDINGIFLIGSNTVSPAPQYFIDANVIQNGVDAVAIYKAKPENFPEETPANTVGLIDALAYDTNDADDDDLLQLLGIAQQINENENGNKDNESIQRNVDGTHSVKAPTPRRSNDGSGVGQIGIDFSLKMEEFTEGDTFEIVFTADQILENTLDFSVNLTNFGFDSADFSGKLELTIPAGSSTVATQIMLTDDDLDEGDEEMVIRFENLPEGFIPLRDRLLIRVVDDDFGISPWGTPLNPTYEVVESTQPVNFYASLNGKAGNNLRQAITALIAAPEIVRAQTYADVIDIVKEADQNPLNNNEVWLLYTEKSRPKLDFQLTSDSFEKWNREHVFPRSRGGFYNIEADEVADGKEIYVTTNVDSIRHGNTDAHALRAVDSRENSRRNNQNYGEYTGPSGTAGSFYGDVARSAFFIALRYTGLEIVNGFPEAGFGKLGDLQTLLQWHRADPPDDFEMHRNNVVYTWQYNRNPFIDYPELVEYLWGNKQGEVWNADLSIQTTAGDLIKIYPNPAQKWVILSGFSGKKRIKLYDTTGKLVLKKTVLSGQRLDLDHKAGIYYLTMKMGTKKMNRKLIIQ